MVTVEAQLIKDRAELFEKFLEEDSKYQERLEEEFSTEKQCYRLEVNLLDLENKVKGTYKDMMNKPAHFLPCFELGLQNFCQTSNRFEKFQKDPRPVRIAVNAQFGRHYVTPRGLDQSLVTKLVCVEGVVTSVSSIQSRLTQSIYYCDNPGSDGPYGPIKTKAREHRDNGSLLWQDIQYNGILKEDQNGDLWDEEFGLCQYKDQQRIVIQEAPENAPTGQIPVSVAAMLEQDLVDKVKPGDRVRVIGVYKAFPKVSNGITSGMFPTRIVANSLKKLKEHVLDLDIKISEVRMIKQISQRPDFFNLLARSFAPSISGNEDVKKGLLLLSVGGAEKNFENGTHLRGDINVLLVGDPSCGKSQMLRFVMNISPLAISTTGRGSSGVGLTAAVKVNQQTGERSLEAGAMVLGDRGIVCIDEFDKMGVNDRVAIHEVMEQQTVTIAKAGIQSTLNARCSVLAAANPIYSTWDDSLSLHQNIALPDSLLSRFDLIYVMKDEITQTKDRKISEQVLRQLRYREERKMAQRDVEDKHDAMLQTNIAEDAGEKNKKVDTFQKNHPSMSDGQTEEILSLDFLKRYLKFAKEKEQQPQLTKAACEKIGVYYAELRQLMKHDNTSQGNLAVTTRTLEAMIRLATGHAKLRLANEVTVDDVEVTRKLLLESRSMEAKQNLMQEGKDDDDLDLADDDLMDVDEEGSAAPKPKRQKKTADEEIDQAVMGTFKQTIFTLFTELKRYDAPVDQLKQRIEEKMDIDPLMFQACLAKMVQQKKIMVEAETVYLTA